MRADEFAAGRRSLYAMPAPAPDTVIFTIDVRGVDPNAVTVDALARLQLAARRLSCRLLLRNASPELLELAAFMGLADVLRESG